jgi:NAD(P)-dependent dehydrogenase (short-subunit alcohol dehydrogenase family)
MQLKDKIAIVTGADSGIGRAIAEKFVEEGAKVVFSDINQTESIEEKYPGKAIFVKCDVSNSAEVNALVAKAVEIFGGLDIMVNNAGIGTQGTVIDMDDETWQKTININLSGVFYGIRAAGKYMNDNKIKGSIINMSSILGEVGFNGSIAYCAAKGGVAQLTKAGAIDLAKVGIKVNAIAPGFIETEMTKGLLQDPATKEFLERSTPMGYVGQPIDIAEAAVYLASDKSSYVTGNILFVDGGWRAW